MIAETRCEVNDCSCIIALSNFVKYRPEYRVYMVNSLPC